MLSGAFTVAETRDKPKMLVQRTVEAFDLHQIQNPPRRNENARPKWCAKLHPAMQRRLQQFAKLLDVEFGITGRQMAPGLRACRKQITI